MEASAIAIDRSVFGLINRRFATMPLALITFWMVVPGVIATEVFVYILVRLFFAHVPVIDAMLITLIVAAIVTPPQLVIFLNAVSNLQKSRNEILKANEELDQRVEQRTSELSEEITRRSKVEAALRESETSLRLITDELPVFIAYIDSDRRYRFANQSYESAFKKPRESIIGLEVAHLLSHVDYAIIRDHLDAALRGEHQEFEANLQSGLPLGQERRFSLRLLPHLGPGDAVLGCFSLVDDITERARVEEHLRQSQRMDAVGNLTGGIAHEFNNLLMTVSGNLGMAEDLATPKQRPLIERAQRAVARGGSLTQRLLAYSRRQPLLPAETNLDELIVQTFELLQQTIGANYDLAYEPRTGEPLWPVNVDPNQMENSLLNLIINARDAMSGGGKIIVETDNIHIDEDRTVRNFTIPAGNYVTIVVSDHGTGMTPETLGRVFEPFFTTKEVGSGTGLGLSMVYGFTKQSGGYIDIESEPEAGTRVTLYLPDSRPEAHALQSQAIS